MITVRTGTYTPKEIEAIPLIAHYLEYTICYATECEQRKQITPCQNCPYSHIRRDIREVTKFYKK